MTPAAGVPWRPLVAITIAVAVAHALALRGAPASLGWPRSSVRAIPVVVRQIPATPPTGASPSGSPAAPVAVAAAQARAPALRATGNERAPATVAATDAASVAPGAASALPPPAAPPAPIAPSAAIAPAATDAPSALPLPPAVVPAGATWHYVASTGWRGLSAVGEAVLAWRHDGSRYDASLVVSVPPLPGREQRSTGTLAADGLRPERFADRARGEEAAHFDRAQDRIVFSSNRPPQALLAGAQDRLSVLLQLAALAAADPARFAAGTTLALQVAGTREAGTWEFIVEGVETLSLPAGPVRAIQLTRRARGEWDPRLDIWLGPAPDYAPVRLRLTPPNGDWLDLQWSGTDKG